MPATGIRFTMFIHDGVKGISETHVYNAETIDVAKPFAIELFKKRMRLCGPPCVPFRGRLSVLGAKRRVRLLSRDELLSIGNAPVENLVMGKTDLGANTSDVPNTCILARRYGSNDQGSTFYVAGVPDAVITLSPAGPIIQQIPQYLTYWNDYCNELKNQAWGFVSRVLDGGGFTSKAVTAVNKDVEDGFLGFSVASAGGAFSVGSTVQARGFKATNRAYKIPQGQYKVDRYVADSPAAGSTTYYLRGTADLTPASIAFLGSLENVDYTTRKITSVTAEGQTTRKRGNRFLSGLGRRTRRVKVSL